MRNYEVSELVKAMIRKGYTIFENDKKNFNLNIVGVRSKRPEVNKFNDTIIVFWKYEGLWNKIQMQITTLPGLHWLEKPINPKGCAILKPGQYRGCWKIDKHRGKYDALCQRLGNVTVYRDEDLDRNYDMIEGVSEETGIFGINIHRASAKNELDTVDKYSAGCQVVQDPQDYALFMFLCHMSVPVYGNKFSYTLLKEDDI